MRHFWTFVVVYTLFILTMKTLWQLDALYTPERAASYNKLNSWLNIGLIRVEGIIQLLIYILPEFIVLICAWTQQFYEILLGVHEKREIETEDIEDARNRFLDQFNIQASRINRTLRINTIKSRPGAAASEVAKGEANAVKWAANAIGRSLKTQSEDVDEYGQTMMERSNKLYTELKNLKIQLQDKE